METRNGITHTFVSIERDEYHKLYDYVTEKRLRVKNIEDKDAVGREKMEDVWSSSDESHDAYLDKVKAEGRERIAEASAGTFAGADFSDDDDEDDEDFAPPDMNSSDSDIAEEYDSNAQSSSSSSGGGSRRGIRAESGSGSDSEASARRKKPAKKPKQSAPAASQKKRESKKAATKKDPNAPSRPSTAYFLWFNENRADIKASLGGSSSVTEVAKAGGERWKTLGADEKAKYTAQAEKLKLRYEEEMKVYKAKIASGEIEAPSKSTGAGSKKSKLSTSAASSSHKKQSSSVSAVATTSQTGGTSGNFKSAEYVSESESSSEGGGNGSGAEGASDSDLSD